MAFLSNLFSPEVKTLPNGIIEITNFKYASLFDYIKRRYKTTRIKEYMFHPTRFGNSKFHMKPFFLLELLYILQEILEPTNKRINKYSGSKKRVIELIDALRTNTWLGNFDTKSPHTLRPDLMSLIKYEFKDYQEEFVKDIYLNKKFNCNLRGYLLAFSPGLGKTFTGLALMKGLNKTKVIITCPKSVIDNAWVKEINSSITGKHTVWTPLLGKPVTLDYDYYVVNYESLNKLEPILNTLSKFDVGMIVDESHNFKDSKSVRTKYLYKVREMLNCEDVLLMTGTPIKALGEEMIPILKLLDPLFTDDVEEDFRKIFGASVPIARELMHNRLGMFMFRKLKHEVLDLPEKTIIEEYIKIPDGDKYTLKEVRKEIEKFSAERMDYYHKNIKKYKEMYDVGLATFEDTLTDDERKAYKTYLSDIKRLIKIGPSHDDAKILIPKVNTYEKEVILPRLSGDIKKNFEKSRAVIKYVELKVMGEVLGGLLNRLRSEMFQKMISHSRLLEIIQDSEKKTVCFTTFVDVAEITVNYLQENKLNPVLIRGSNSKDANSLLKSFETTAKLNPVVAMIQVLSTGVTILSANTVVFLNVPWRSVDFEQASDRVHRIGQDTPVFIYKFILATGKNENLSTRMDSILQWSNEMFNSIVDNIDVNAVKVDKSKLDNIVSSVTSVEEKSMLEEILSVFNIFKLFGFK